MSKLKVVYKPDNTPTIEDLEVGEVFSHNGRFYIKLFSSAVSNGVLDVHTFNVVMFDVDSANIQRHSATLIIEKEK